MSTRVTRALASACVLVGVFSLSSCTTPEEASDLPQPEIVWDGGEPTGELWDSKWAAAYLEANIQLSLANAYGDYSDPDLIAALSYDGALRRAEANSDFRFGTPANQHRNFDSAGLWAYYGTILDVDVSADGRSALVMACTAGWSGSDVVPDELAWRITKNADGSYMARMEPGVMEQESVDAEVWIGAWAEPIDILDVGRDEVKMPLPREYYVELGVISE